MFGARNASVSSLARHMGLAVIALTLSGRMAAAQDAFGGKGLADRQPLASTTATVPFIQPAKTEVRPEAVLRDISELPAPVALMRSRILAAAKSGDLGAVKALISDGSVILSSAQEPADDPVRTWRRQYPESNGVEILSILVGILESGFVRLDAGAEREIYVWPYFAHIALKNLDPPRLVELYRLLTAFDVQRMREAGSYTFFRVGIGADGKWQYFVSGQ